MKAFLYRVCAIFFSHFVLYPDYRISFFIPLAFRFADYTFGPALQPYDFIYVDDLIEAVYRLGFKETNKPFYYIGSGNPKVLKDYLIRIGELVGCADKVGIGVREDDGVKYTMDMFDNSNLVSTIGEYASIDFDKGINKTINWLKNSLML